MTRTLSILAALILGTSLGCIPTLSPAPGAGDAGSNAANRDATVLPDGRIVDRDVANGTDMRPTADAGDLGFGDGGSPDMAGCNPSCALLEVQVGCSCEPDLAGLTNLIERCEMSSGIGSKQPPPSAGPGTGTVRASGTVDEIAGGTFTSPVTLSASGHYRLTGDVDADGGAFVIEGPSILLDLNGHTITYGMADSTTQFGVTLSSSTTATVTNGTIVQGLGTCDVSSSPSCAAVHIASGTAELHALELRTTGTFGSVIKAESGTSVLIQNSIIDDETEPPEGTILPTLDLTLADLSRLYDNVIERTSRRGITIGTAMVERNSITFGQGTDASTAITVAASSNPLIQQNNFFGSGGAPTVLVASEAVFNSNYVELESDEPGPNDANGGARCLEMLGAPNAANVRCNWFELKAGAPIAGLTTGEYDNRSWGVCASVAANTIFADNFIRAIDSSNGASLAAAVEVTGRTNSTLISQNVIDSSTPFILNNGPYQGGLLPILGGNSVHGQSAEPLITDLRPFSSSSAGLAEFRDTDWNGRDPCDPSQVALSETCGNTDARIVSVIESGDVQCAYSTETSNGTEIDPDCGAGGLFFNQIEF